MRRQGRWMPGAQKGWVSMFHLGWFLGEGYAVQRWSRDSWSGSPWAGSNRWDWTKPDMYVDLAASLERGGFDYILVEDTLMLEDTYRGSLEPTLAHGHMGPKNDPVPLIPLMTQRTKHIGVAVTLSTSFYHPYHAARTMTTLDHLTGGRVGLNVVTSVSHRSAQNFGLDQHYRHAERYRMAHEWMDAANALWESWEPDAVNTDELVEVYADHTKVHVPNFEGEYYRTRGPLSTIPGPQGKPVIVQAGNSDPGRELAARYAETMLAHSTSIEWMKAFRADIHRRMEKYGRKPSECKVMFLIDPILGDSDAIARERQKDMHAAASTPEAIEDQLWGLTYSTGGEYDFSQADLDAPVADIVGNGETSTLRAFIERSHGRTLREAVTGGYRTHGALDFCGSPDTVAAMMGEVMAEVGGDGFLLSPSVTRRHIAEIADGLAPALRRRGLIRDGYNHTTFRENLLDF
ncbi:NtaA/DmoA family FMN-dependent monooxygenase [Phytohabitans rumicis]